ncbi:unnamed protein product (plasmid) [Mycetohabitans rhizoxinica HKI 454]|uniref:Uncharacterized protein n=1 Tax=Mycetohabitans rhizoxinica (strain DSM 19002 / CIP 109453 / HKI 454) TaxID=882378 RepID=E5AVP9_MYCRK|nr:unnamed protein product [Mycetohabitans rhizoxinica HKI 454]
MAGGTAARSACWFAPRTRRRSVREDVVARSLFFQDVHGLRDADDARLRAPASRPCGRMT